MLVPRKVKTLCNPGTWPVLLGPSDVKIRPVVKGAETDVWSIAEDIPGYEYI